MGIEINTTMLERTIAAADKQLLLNELSYLNEITTHFYGDAGDAFDAAHDNPPAFLRAYLANTIGEAASKLFDMIIAEINRRKEEANHDTG